MRQQLAPKSPKEVFSDKTGNFCSSVLHNIIQRIPPSTKCQIITDHRTLVWLYSFKEPDAIVAQQLEKLSMVNFESIDGPGKSIANADNLSRITEVNLYAASLTLVSQNCIFSDIQDRDKTLSVVKSWCISN